MTDQTPNTPVAGEVIITTRSQIVNALISLTRELSDDEYYLADNMAYEQATDMFIKALHTVK